MKKSFIILLRDYLAGKTTGKEKEFVEEYYDAFDSREDILSTRSTEEKKLLADEMKQRILQRTGLVVIPLYRRTWFRAAAAVLVLLGTAATFYLLAPSVKKETPLLTQEQTIIVPGSKKAILTLADGSSITLDDAQKGKLTMQGHTSIVKQDEGQLLYDQHQAATDSTYYNTVRTPRGGEYQVVLPDGSRVWLNAASSLRFPTAFKGNERRVELTGEAYFEVTKSTRPFIASVNNMEVKVLGTHFNIKAYEDEANIKTTLLEGAVRVTSQQQSVILAPGQQAAVSSGNSNIKVQQVDLEEQVAWKNGHFHFSGEKITTVMKQLERWYDLDIVYEGTPSHHFTGTISRRSDITKVLKTLEMTGSAHFKTTGRKITVLP